MKMVAFYERFGEIAFDETRTLSVPAGNPVPADEYGYLEYYCIDKECDCRRVIIRVLGRHSGNKVWASISYGWEKPSFYHKGSPGMKNAADWSRPTLDPLNPQTAHSESFLAAFKQMIQDKAYVDRLKRHYKMFKKSV
jgi:hypothetical protein